MASTSGTFSSYPSLLTYIVTADEVATNIAANQSTVRVKAYIQFTGSSASSSGGSGSTSAGGWSRGFTSFSGGGTIEVFSNDITVGHSADGSGSYSFSGSASMSGWGSASTGTGVLGLSNFDFTAGVPASMTATYTPGVGVGVSWTASTSYITPVTYYHSYRSSSNGGVSYGSWSSETSTTSLSANYNSLTPGLTYQFRVRAYNGQDNYSGYRESNTVFLTAGGKRYAGPNPVTDWILTAAQAKRWTGSAWTSLGTLKRFDGTNWVSLS